MARNDTSPVVKKGENLRVISRLVRYLAADRVRMTIMILSGLIGVTLIVAGPKIMAQGTDILFTGILGV
ncbi:MAG: ABC transporter ATP-binding protein, partial [Alloscardovia omnicolens]|nr:ABC transporter ATP-binding protein [Alloscardovia omnicolens]